MVMIDKKVFSDALANYKRDFVAGWWENEKFKWEAVKCFQDNWNIDAEDFSFSLPFVGGELLLAAFRMRGERGSESVEPEMAAGSVFFVWGPDLCQAGCGHESAQFRKHNDCSHKIAVESSHAFRLARQQPGGQEGQACGTGRGRKRKQAYSQHC